MDIKNRIAEIIGEASMCWSETPTGVFLYRWYNRIDPTISVSI